MGDLLRGNFETRNKVRIENEKEPSLEARYEKEALKKLGGSIAFVSKKKVVWDLGADEKNKT